MSDAKNDYEVVYEDGKPAAVRIRLQARDGSTRAWATVDYEDWPRVKEYRWGVHRNKYAQSGAAPGNLLHRLITRAPKGMDVHHRDGDGFNNRRANLEVLTPSEHKIKTYANGEIDRKALRKGIRRAYADPDNRMGSEEHRRAMGEGIRRAYADPDNYIGSEEHRVAIGRAKATLTDDEVLEARRLYATGDWSYQQLAEKYEVSYHIIYNAVTGRTYKWVPRVASSTPRQLVQRETRDG